MYFGLSLFIDLFDLIYFLEWILIYAFLMAKIFSSTAGSAKNSNYLEASGNSNGEGDEEWLRISEMQLRYFN